MLADFFAQDSYFGSGQVICSLALVVLRPPVNVNPLTQKLTEHCSQLKKKSQFLVEQIPTEQ